MLESKYPPNPSWLDEEGNAHQLCGPFEFISKVPKEVVTIICNGNTDLYERLCQLVMDEYGPGMIERSDHFNAFGYNVADFTPRLREEGKGS